MTEPQDDEEKFSDDPEEQLRMENEILKLKLNAELGGKFESLAEIPAEIENLFLKNVIAFEHEHAKADTQTVYDVLGRPDYKPASGLDDQQIELELLYLEKLMEEKSILVDYLVEYPARTKYTFLTEELFAHESSMFTMPGMTTHYIYEEFHPNHEYDIKQRTTEFIKDWFKRRFSSYSTGLANQFILPSHQSFSRQEVVDKLQLVFDSYTRFLRTNFRIKTVGFVLNEDVSGTGFSEGTVSYDAVMEDGETIRIKGKFRLEFQMNDNFWQVCYFSWPGFKW